MTQARSPSSEIIAEINITPFTDVLLVLLIIFMILAALSTPPGFQKQIAPSPHSGHSDILPQAAPIVVTVTGADAVTLDGKGTSYKRLYEMMSDVIDRHRKRHQSLRIELVADSQTSYNAIIRILDAARRAGDEDVGFVLQ
jgi:biopolymer transport protein ExbD